MCWVCEIRFQNHENQTVLSALEDGGVSAAGTEVSHLWNFIKFQLSLKYRPTTSIMDAAICHIGPVQLHIWVSSDSEYLLPPRQRLGGQAGRNFGYTLSTEDCKYRLSEALERRDHLAIAGNKGW